MKLEKMRINFWQIIVFDSLNFKSISLLELAIELLLQCVRSHIKILKYIYSNDE